MSIRSPEPVHCSSCRALNARDNVLCCECRTPLPPAAIDASFRRPGGVRLRPMLPETRARKRRGVQIEGVVVLGGGVARHLVTVWNIHEGGLQFRTPFEYTMGAEVTICIPLDGHRFIVRARVRYVGQVVAERTKTWACGVEFVEPNPALAAAAANLRSGARAV
ncbi:MAG TPA: PilZ domain-containing protein [Chthonomonadales bacterium]|nr:PilZ domain-containing protein [Chthonomonadales bacterium]